MKSKPHDTETQQTIIQNQLKIDGNRGLDWSWELLGEAWEPFGLPRPSSTEKKARRPKNSHVWAPILKAIFNIVRYFRCLFAFFF